MQKWLSRKDNKLALYLIGIKLNYCFFLFVLFLCMNLDVQEENSWKPRMVWMSDFHLGFQWVSKVVYVTNLAIFFLARELLISFRTKTNLTFCLDLTTCVPLWIYVTYLVLDDIFGTVLSLYMHDKTQSLPSSEEVLICTSDTTAEEVGIVRLQRLLFMFVKFYQNFFWRYLF